MPNQIILHGVGARKDESAPDPLAHRRHAARLANHAREAGDPSSWFEPMYQWANGDAARVPWADGRPHPLLVEWSQTRAAISHRAAVVGCGLGDDAEFVAARSASVWAFDVSPTAIEWAARLHPQSKVSYQAADLFQLPPSHARAYDLVVEVYTLQALSPESRPAAIAAIAELVAPGGAAIIITRIREPEAELGPVPWPLTLDEVHRFLSHGLALARQWGEPELAGFEFVRPRTE